MPAQLSLEEWIVKQFNELTHKHRWSRSYMHEANDVLWVACSCGARLEYDVHGNPRMTGGINVEL